MTNIFTEKTIAGSLQQMADQTTLPTLFMYTVIQAVAKYPNLTKYVNNILPLQMTKKIWTNSILWKGFIKYCTVSKKILAGVLFYGSCLFQSVLNSISSQLYLSYLLNNIGQPTQFFQRSTSIAKGEVGRCFKSRSFIKITVKAICRANMERDSEKKQNAISRWVVGDKRINR